MRACVLSILTDLRDLSGVSQIRCARGSMFMLEWEGDVKNDGNLVTIAWSWNTTGIVRG